jgi:hypothetical protein
MRKFFVAFQLLSVLSTIAGSPKFKDTMDNICDLLEDNFPEEETVQRVCGTIRMVFNVPDDDD